MEQACKLIGEIPGHTILGFLDNAVARNGIVKQLIKFVKKDTVSAQPVLASRSKAIKELHKTAKQPNKQQTKATGPMRKQKLRHSCN